MPKYQIKPSSRAKAAIAAVMAMSSMIGGGYYVLMCPSNHSRQ